MTLTSTYRLQLQERFGFAEAAAAVPYLARLGVSHLYLSPILAAAAGSTHGYDVVDHTRISEILGGRSGFEALAELAHAHDLGIVVDVVPNHMAFVAPESANLPLWRVLRDGRDAPTATWFDIDWKAGGGRLGLPVLGDDLATILAAGELVIDEIECPVAARGRARAVESGESAGELPPVPTVPVIRYYDHVYPIALGTEGDIAVGERDAQRVRAVLERQHYRLAGWREKDEVLNYRRFFEVDGLIAVRVEIPEVFAATHDLLLELHHAGLIDGFRIDHPDGLADPAAYLEQLTQASRRGTPIWVEKILESGEDLPRTWPCAGTTGYDALRAISAALVDTAAEPEITECWIDAGGTEHLADTVAAAKRQVVAQSLVPEVERLTRRAREAEPTMDPQRLRAAVVELLVAGEVYRAYLRPDSGQLSPETRARLASAFSAALAARPDLEPELRALVPMTVADEDDPAHVDFCIRLQQTWGPVMAKGVEDTTFYRWHRLVALNEVGSDPRDLDRPEPPAAALPAAGLDAAGLDVARLAVVGRSTSAEPTESAAPAEPAASVDQPEFVGAAEPVSVGPREPAEPEVPRETRQSGVDLLHAWAGRQQQRWPRGMTTLSTHDTKRSEDVRARLLAVAGDRAGWRRCSQAAATAARSAEIDGPTAHLLWQTLVGVGDMASDRLEQYLIKAIREAKEHTAWVDGDPAYEERVLAFARAHGESGPLRDAVAGLLADNAEAIAATVLAQKVLALTLPGTPDTYQGCEIVDLSLVDPDNRRPVDLARRAAALERIIADPSPPLADLDARKLWVTARILGLRQRRPEVFGRTSTYAPLAGLGPHAIGFLRTAGAGRIASALGWARPDAVAVLVTRAPARLAASGGWAAVIDPGVELPDGRWRDLLGSAELDAVGPGRIPLAEVFAQAPVAVLVRS